MRACCDCKHFCQKSHLVTTGERNVSGGLAMYRKWSKHRCALKQEDRYPRNCDFEVDEERQKELNERFPDLALANARIKEISESINQTRSDRTS